MLDMHLCDNFYGKNRAKSCDAADCLDNAKFAVGEEIMNTWDDTLK